MQSCAVIGLPDDDMGNPIHAIVEADAGARRPSGAADVPGERLATYKLPRTFEFVDVALRDDAGKVRRAALRAERMPA